MKVKISVKKLYEMEQIIAALKDGQKRYRDQIGDMFNANEDRKEQLINQAETINYLTDENDALKEKVEKLDEAYRDRVAALVIVGEELNNKIAEADASLTRKEETINYLTDENDALKKEVEILSHQLKHWFQSWVGSQLEVEDLKKDRNDWEDAARSAADNL